MTTQEKIDSVKSRTGADLVLFRLGDFYEAFHDDAEIIAGKLGLTLTTRDRSGQTSMCGFPYHQLDTYLGKLKREGLVVEVISD